MLAAKRTLTLHFGNTRTTQNKVEKARSPQKKPFTINLSEQKQTWPLNATLNMTHFFKLFLNDVPNCWFWLIYCLTQVPDFSFFSSFIYCQPHNSFLVCHWHNPGPPSEQMPIKNLESRQDTESFLLPALRKQFNTPDYSETAEKPTVRLHCPPPPPPPFHEKKKHEKSCKSYKDNPMRM